MKHPKNLATLLCALWLPLALCQCTGPNPPSTGGDSDMGGDGDQDPGDGDSGDEDVPGDCQGQSPSIVVGEAQSLNQLIESSEACMLYGVDASGGHVYFVDIDTDTVAQTLDLGAPPVDIALVPESNELYVALHDSQEIVALDALTGAELRRHSTTMAPFRLARGVGRTVYYVERDEYSAVHHMDMVSGNEETVTGSDFIEPDLAATRDGTHLFVGESGLWGEVLVHFSTDDGLVEEDRYVFPGLNGLPTPTRHVHINEQAGRIYFADRALDLWDFSRIRGWFGAQILSTTGDGTVGTGDDFLYDTATFVDFSQRPHPRGGPLFSSDGAWLYEFAAEGSVLYRTSVQTLLGVHLLGETVSAAGPLSQRDFQMLVADPNRPLLYGLDTSRNELVIIDRQTHNPIRAEVIGSAPTDLALSADGDTMVAATFGATEIAVLDLTNATKALANIIVVPQSPFRVALSPLDEVVYVEQDGYATLTSASLSGNIIGASSGDDAYQADTVFDETGRFLYVAESSTDGARLFRLDADDGPFDFANAVVTTESFFYPSRIVIYRAPYVYFAGRKFDATTLENLGQFDEDIITVSPNGRWAMSRTRVFDTACVCLVEGAPGLLPVDSTVMAVDPDNTVVYQFDDSTGGLFEHALPSE